MERDGLMEQETYLEERLNKQLAWYSKKSTYNRKCFERLRVLEIIAAGSIPFLAGMSKSIDYSEWIIGFLGLLIVISVGLISLYKYQENWIQYRSTAETLKHEKYLFLNNCAPYDSEDAFKLLVSRIEGIISKENSSWSSYIKKTTGPKKSE